MLACVSPAMAEVMVGGLGGAPTMVIEKAWLPGGGMPLAALTVKPDVPSAVGVPEIIPVERLRFNPGGNVPCVNNWYEIVGAPLATTVYE